MTRKLMIVVDLDAGYYLPEYTSGTDLDNRTPLEEAESLLSAGYEYASPQILFSEFVEYSVDDERSKINLARELLSDVCSSDVDEAHPPPEVKEAHFVKIGSVILCEGCGQWRIDLLKDDLSAPAGTLVTKHAIACSGGTDGVWALSHVYSDFERDRYVAYGPIDGPVSGFRIEKEIPSGD